MSESSPLQVSVGDGIAVLTMNQPHKLNALSAEMSSLGKRYLAEFAADPEVRVVILTGAGRAFCAGGDVGNMAADKAPKTFEEKLDGLRSGQEFSWQLHSLPKPTIAAVNGYAVGAGLGIALSCDIRIASDKAKFGTAYARVGLGGDYGTTWQLTRLVGPAKAKEMFFLADNLDAAKLIAWGWPTASSHTSGCRPRRAQWPRASRGAGGELPLHERKTSIWRSIRTSARFSNARRSRTCAARKPTTTAKAPARSSRSASRISEGVSRP